MANSVPGGAAGGAKLPTGKTRVSDLTGEQLSGLVTGAVFKALFAFALLGGLMAVAVLVLASCGGDSGTADDSQTIGSSSGGAAAMLCVPGRSEACVGPGGCQGGQVCAEDGSGFGDCACGPAGSGGTTAGAGGSSGSSGGAEASSGGAQPSLVVRPDGSRWDCVTHYEVTTGGAAPTACSCVQLAPPQEPVGCPEDAPAGTCEPGPCGYRGGCCVTAGAGCQCVDGAAFGSQGCAGVTPAALRTSCP